MARSHPRRRSTTVRRTRRRGRASGRGSSWGWLLVGGLVAGLLVVNWLAERGLLGLAGVLVAVAGVASLGLYLAWAVAARRQRLARTRSIAVADALSGPEFEHWFADLLRRSGFTHVQVSGGGGDLGADVVGFLPDGRRLVAQCKRHRDGRRVGSPAVQKLAGTARSLHEADVAVIVTNSDFTAPAEVTAARLGIGLVGRDSLARWAADGLLPIALVRPTPSSGPVADILG